VVTTQVIYTIDYLFFMIKKFTQNPQRAYHKYFALQPAGWQ